MLAAAAEATVPSAESGWKGLQRLYGGPPLDESYQPAQKLREELEASEYGTHRLHLLGFNPDVGQEHEGRAIVAVGNPDPAQHPAGRVGRYNKPVRARPDRARRCLRDKALIRLAKADGDLSEAAAVRWFGITPDGRIAGPDDFPCP